MSFAFAQMLAEHMESGTEESLRTLEEFLDVALAQRSCLSDKAIKRARDEGRIYIKPFNPANLATSSYDVTLGRYYFRENIEAQSPRIYNVYDPDHVRQVWGDAHSNIRTGMKAGEWCMRYAQQALVNISPEEEIIVLDPGETILAHTEEFIGGCDTRITTMMKARSSLGRNFISVCKCAGWGDVGYHNRWTMEITNLSQRYQIPLVVGRRIAQIVFFETEGVEASLYSDNGKYQRGQQQELENTWHASMMLPRMFQDREVRDRFG